MGDINFTISITLNVNEVNNVNKKAEVNRLGNKTRFNYMLSARKTL